MSRARLILLTALTMAAFAGNSLLCRLALAHTAIDAATFTTVRLASGAAMLWLLTQWRPVTSGSGGGRWLSGLALFAYAACFSFAYISLPAGTGALLLFGAVQVTMVLHDLRSGKTPRMAQAAGMALAAAGLVWLVLPGVSAPPLLGSLLMLASGVAWGIYSLRGRGAGDPTRVTAGNFLRAVPFSIALSIAAAGALTLDPAGVAYALASGAITSAIGYVIWYSVLPSLSATSAATVQLSVPVIAAFGGIVLLGENLTLRLVASSIAILGGIAMVIRDKGRGG
ncbi:DMT family transporter [Ramlibacter solisilvae]|uniref:Membrane protein n=1 Tax=Ramlibacter tataouinensis TaxID=94132 RepID=A0A127JNZ3_9BURK|nr:DMT family transporter [Ramlibacter tataouinensis]AMO21744.1 membrane protein [Ramlibacter tataouinensis]